MRRYISLVCVALIIIMCMVEPVSAADLNDTTYFNVLNYSFPNNSGGTFLWYEGESIFFELPYGIYPYIDFVVRSNSSTLKAYSTHPSSSSDVALNVVLIGTYNGTYIYRVYGNTHGFAGDYLYVDFTLNDSSYIDFLSFYASNVTANYFDSDCYMTIGTIDYDSNIHYVSTDEVNYRTFTGTDDFLLANYTSYLYNLNWKKYDYIDYIVFLSVDSVTTVTCTMGGVTVPFEMSFVDNDAMTYHDFMISIRVDCRELDRTSGDYPMVTFQGNVITGEVNMISVMSCYGVIVNSLDIEMGLLQKFMNLVSKGIANLSNLMNSVNSSIKTQGTYLRQNINTNFETLSTWISEQTTAIGTAISDMDSNLDAEITKTRVAINDRFAELNTWITAQTTSLVTSINEMNTNLDGEINKVRVAINTNFEKLDKWLISQTETLEAAIRGDTAPGDKFQDDVDQKDQQLDQMAAVMDSVDRPELEAVNVSANSYVNSTVLASSMAGITTVIGGPVFLDVIMMSLMMATAGYVLFGKR